MEEMFDGDPYAALSEAGLVVDTDRPLIGLLDPHERDSTLVAAYDNELEFAEFGSYIVPSRFFAIVYDGDSAPVSFEAGFELGQVIFHQLVLRQDSARDISRSGREFARSLENLVVTVSSLLAQCLRQTTEGVVGKMVIRDRSGIEGWFAAYQDEVKPVPPQRGKELGDEHWEKVAEVYRAALMAGKNPTQAVADTFQRPYSTAARWVLRARKAGKLGPPPAPGQPGEKRDDTNDQK
jgi:hypothetical protein